MPDNLRNRIINALSWSFVGRISDRFIGFFMSILMARLLAPEMFGLIGMLTIFTGTAYALMDSGFSLALIQKKNPDHIDKCTAFYFNVFMGIFLYIILYLTSPLIARFYDEPVLIPLTRLLALQFLIGPFAMVQGAMMRKEFRFKAKAKIQVLNHLTSGIVGIILAFTGYGVWAIAFQQLTGAFIGTALHWHYMPWRPTATFSFKAFRSLFSFGGYLMLPNLIRPVFDNLYNVVIGRMFSPAALGLYTKAQTLERKPTKTLTHTIQSVMFPAYSEIQNQPARLKNLFSRSLRTLAMVNFPMMLGMAVAARPMVHVLLGEQWLEMVPYLQILCLNGMLYPFVVINSNIILSIGRSDLYFRLSLLSKIFIIANLSISWRWGVLGLLFGQALLGIIGFLLRAGYTQKATGYLITTQIGESSPYLAISAVMGIAVYSLNWIFPALNDAILLACQVLAGGTVYILLCRLLKLSAFMETWDLVREAALKYQPA